MAQKSNKKPDASKDIKQQAKVEGGNSYQAGGIIHISRIAEPKKTEKKVDKLQKWLAVIISFTVIITFIFGLPKMIEKFSTPESTRFYGIVIDETGQPVADAEIVIRGKEGDNFHLGSGKSSSTGEFNFSVKARPDATIWVTVVQNGHVGFKGYKNFLEHDPILFKRKK